MALKKIELHRWKKNRLISCDIDQSCDFGSTDSL
ncbi:hypothetical protein M6B38_109680 [Iris pallida]|uniref:Uncharacterized protein n=1 Tax=Iris pallida TaxID=29817 RepID=A0AAX6E906_IRIPA|nr:hypothetical protein M6B38_109680 [Iris pallida]